MFDQILQLVKDHFSNNPEVAAAIPAEQTDAVHREIATHVNDGLQAQAPAQGGIGGLLSQLGGGNLASSAISGGLVGSLGSKFGLSPAITGAIAAALPGRLAKLAQQSGGQKTGGLSSFL